MIGSLRGALVARETGEVTIEVAGVGYRVTVAPTAPAALAEVGDEVFVWTHHHQREDAQTLYGFASLDERRCFEALLGAHGVGPALALAILSVHSPDALARAVAVDDAAALCLVPGVGRKTAARLLIELKSRLAVPSGTAPAGPGAGDDHDPLDGSAALARADVRAALDELGYTEAEIGAVMADLPEAPDSSALLRDALARLAGSGR